ncbi:hypothetical protein GH714_014261 [Hevea brasiliensis]|uniref:R13L1/DRL21-like LRR repeat region domain-containing protein n=1 Tax=Hevea brasiliensis TaxID=3981 RepID=A0A6A6N336_HEVBR|nr:hypothetical protein GH714_014261 [Hevea brasiliensis]
MPSKVGRLTSLERLSLFAVGTDRGGSIEELECLNQLSSELEISYLEEVRNKEEAKKSNLQWKTKLKALRFRWRPGVEWNFERESSSNDEEVLEGLEPHSNIERKRILIITIFFSSLGVHAELALFVNSRRAEDHTGLCAELAELFTNVEQRKGKVNADSLSNRVRTWLVIDEDDFTIPVTMLDILSCDSEVLFDPLDG